MDGPARTRRLTEGLPGVGGRIRVAHEDFLVEELPLYEALDEGDHVVFELEKRGTSTFEALLWLSKAVKVSEHAIGYAGLKDARAVTRQWMSVHRVPPERLLAVRHARLRVLQARRHPSRVRIGHLLGNRFTIRIRDADLSRLDGARQALAVLVARGVPNAYGNQRFGLKQDGHLLGRAIVHRRFDEFLSHLLGRPHRREGDPRVTAARSAYDRGALAEAFELFPMKHRVQKQALSALLRDGSPEDAFLALGKRARRIYVSAYQSWLFNRCLDARLARDDFDRLLRGDLAWQHASGALYPVRDPAAEAPRASAMEASPTGPLPGYDARTPEGEPGDVEAAVLAGEGLHDALYRDRRVRIRGARRPLRVPLRDASLEVEGDSTLVARFTLPPGAFATVVLRELMKNDGGPGVDPHLPHVPAEGPEEPSSGPIGDPFGDADPDDEAIDDLADLPPGGPARA